MKENGTRMSMEIRRAPASGWESAQMGARSASSAERPAHLPPLIPMEERKNPLQTNGHVLFENNAKGIPGKKPNRPIW